MLGQHEAGEDRHQARSDGRPADPCGVPADDGLAGGHQEDHHGQEDGQRAERPGNRPVSRADGEGLVQVSE